MSLKATTSGLQALGRLRDGILLLGGLVYLLGYTVWSLASLRAGLGPRPVLDAQYFVAGVPALAVLFLALTTARLWHRWLMKIWTPAFAEWSTGAQFAFYYSSGSLAFVGMLILLVPKLRHYLATQLAIGDNELAILAGTVAFLLFMVTPPTANRLILAHIAWKYAADTKRRPLFPFIRETLASTEPASRIAPITYIYGFSLLLACGGIWLYATRLYPLIPQTLGGSKPRCATLDLITEKLSDQTLAELSVQQRSNATVRTAPLQVILMTTDSIVVVAQHGQFHPIEELRRDSVTAVSWCEDVVEGAPHPTAPADQKAPLSGR